MAPPRMQAPAQSEVMTSQAATMVGATMQSEEVLNAAMEEVAKEAGEMAKETKTAAEMVAPPMHSG